MNVATVEATVRLNIDKSIRDCDKLTQGLGRMDSGLGTNASTFKRFSREISLSTETMRASITAFSKMKVAPNVGAATKVIQELRDSYSKLAKTLNTTVRSGFANWSRLQDVKVARDKEVLAIERRITQERLELANRIMSVRPRVLANLEESKRSRYAITDQRDIAGRMQPVDRSAGVSAAQSYLNSKSQLASLNSFAPLAARATASLKTFRTELGNLSSSLAANAQHADGWYERFGRIAIGFAIAYSAIRTVQAGFMQVFATFKGGIQTMDDIVGSGATISGMLAMLTENGKSFADNFTTYFTQFKSTFQQALVLLPQYSLSLEQFNAGVRELAQFGVALDPSKLEANINAMKVIQEIASNTKSDTRQIRQEIQAMMNGQTRRSDQFALFVKAGLPDLQAEIEAMRKAGKTTQEMWDGVNARLMQLAPAMKAGAKTVGTQIEVMRTSISLISAKAIEGTTIYKLWVDKLTEFNSKLFTAKGGLTEFGEEIYNGFYRAWQVVNIFVNTALLVAKVIKLIGQQVYAVFTSNFAQGFLGELGRIYSSFINITSMVLELTGKLISLVNFTGFGRLIGNIFGFVTAIYAGIVAVTILNAMVLKLIGAQAVKLFIAGMTSMTTITYGFATATGTATAPLLLVAGAIAATAMAAFSLGAALNGIAMWMSGGTFTQGYEQSFKGLNELLDSAKSKFTELITPDAKKVGESYGELFKEINKNITLGDFTGAFQTPGIGLLGDDKEIKKQEKAALAAQKKLAREQEKLDKKRAKDLEKFKYDPYKGVEDLFSSAELMNIAFDKIESFKRTPIIELVPQYKVVEELVSTPAIDKFGNMLQEPVMKKVKKTIQDGIKEVQTGSYLETKYGSTVIESWRLRKEAVEEYGKTISGVVARSNIEVAESAEKIIKADPYLSTLSGKALQEAFDYTVDRTNQVATNWTAKFDLLKREFADYQTDLGTMPKQAFDGQGVLGSSNPFQGMNLSISETQEAYQLLQDEQKRLSTNWDFELAKMKLSFQSFGTYLGGSFKGLFSSVFNHEITTFAQFFQGALKSIQQSFSDMLSDMVSDYFTAMMKMQFRDNVMGMLGNAFGGGNVAGDLTSSPSVSPALSLPTARNTRFAGGMINEPVWGVGKSGATYSFAEKGPERVLSNSDSKEYARGSSASPNVINFINESGVPMTATQSAPQFDGEKYVTSIIVKQMATNPSFRSSMRG